MTNSKELYEPNIYVLYLKEINKIPSLTKEQEIEAAKNKNLSKLIKANLKLVVNIAKKYQSRKNQLEDLIGVGNIELIKAATKYDYKRGIRFSTYAYPRIRGSILDYIRRNQLIKIPEKALRNRKKITQIWDSIAQKKQKIQTYLDLPQEVDKEDYEVFNNWGRLTQILSINMPVDKDPDSATLEDIIPAQEYYSPVQITENNDYTKKIRQVVATLPKRERFIIENFYGLYDKPCLSQEKIGFKLDISKSMVSLIVKKAKLRLKNKGQIKELSIYLN